MRCERLGPKESPRFRQMTFPAYRPLLDLQPAVLHADEGVDRKTQPIAVGAFLGGEPLGLALAGIPMGIHDDPELLSVFVNPASRQQGIANLLLSEIETAVRDEGFRRLVAVYMTGRPGAVIMEHLFEKHHWAPPETRMITVKFTVREAMTTPWYRKYSVRSNLEIFPWRELTEEDRSWLQESQRDSGWIAEDLVPWNYDQRGFEPFSSVGARLDGKVVGWVINHRVGGDIVRFTCSYIRPDLKQRGRIVPLYSESIRRLSETPYERCSLTVPMHHRPMVAFVKRHCASWVSFVGETRGTEKEL
ncbi:MAG: GNAT family N-acetyltransferase [Deltaproteobacteria bacterium]|nr:GNAT family N-acetyltransferase [Deltaproteobacteria bacterium]